MVISLKPTRLCVCVPVAVIRAFVWFNIQLTLDFQIMT